MLPFPLQETGFTQSVRNDSLKLSKISATACNWIHATCSSCLGLLLMDSATGNSWRKVMRPRPGTPLHPSCCAGHKRNVLGHTWAMLNLLTLGDLEALLLHLSATIWSKGSCPTVQQYFNISMYSRHLPAIRVAVHLQAFHPANKHQHFPGAFVSPQGRHLLRRWQPHSLLDCYRQSV